MKKQGYLVLKEKMPLHRSDDTKAFFYIQSVEKR